MACPCFAEMLSTSAPPLLDTLSRGGGHIQGGVILEENQGYVIRRTILFDNKCGFVLGENPKAPPPEQEKPLDKVKEPPHRRRSLDREDR